MARRPVDDFDSTPVESKRDLELRKLRAEVEALELKNKPLKKHPGGRPRIIKSPEEAQKKIDNMFDELEPGEIPTVEDLVLCLGLSSRQSLIDYEKKPEFIDTIKKAKIKIFNIQKKLAFNNKANATVFIFNAKNNHGMTDKSGLEVTTIDEEGNSTGILTRLSAAYDKAGKDSNI